jgi:hypothetical protein
VGSLLQLSKEMYEAVGPTIHTLELASGWVRDAAALVRLLRHAPNLQRLVVEDSVGDEEVRLLMQALGDGSVGSQLRSLSLPYMSDNAAFSALMNPFEAGGLPHLTDLMVTLPARQGPTLGDALEARRALGLPPITRFMGGEDLGADSLRRIWTCCPPDTIMELSTWRASHVAALGDYVMQHPNSSFSALRSLELSAWVEGQEKTEALVVAVPTIPQAIEQGRFAIVQEMKLDAWNEQLSPPHFAGPGHRPEQAAPPVLILAEVQPSQFRGLPRSCRRAQGLPCQAAVPVFGR